jgi:antitoxin CptB
LNTAGHTRWRCRRGMKELDVLLERYMSTGWPQASADERALFDQLLELPDPQLAAYLLGHAVPAHPPLAQLTHRIACGSD